MSSPEGKVQTPEGRIVLSQDLPQYEQSVQKKRQQQAAKEQAEYDAAVKEYEKDVKAAEAQYQKDLAAYEKQQREAENAQNKYDAEIKKLEAQKQKELADAHYSVWGPGGSRNRSELNQKQNAIIKNYNSAINKQVEQKRVQTGYQEFSIAYPGQVIPANVAKTFRESPSFSLTGLYEQKVEGKAAKAEYQRQASAQTAQAESTKLSREYHAQIPNMGFITSYGLEEGSQRAGAIKSTPETSSVLLGGGKQAVKTRQRLTNVDTGQSIMGGQQAAPAITITRTETYRETPDGPVLVRNVERTIPEKKASKGVPSFANPVAFVASLDRQNVDAAGISLTKIQPKETQSIYSFENVSNVQDPSAIALLDFQQQLKTRTAPSATVYKGILEDKGLPITPLASRIIDVYSSKGIFRDYKEPVQAKGRKAIISKDGKQIFDIETGMGDVTIGRKLGFVYDYNLQRPTIETPKTFEGSLGFVVSPKVQGPQQPKFEEAVGAVGTIEYALAPEPKQTSFNKSLENQYNKLGELQEITAKKAKSGDPRDLLVQIAYAPSEAMRSVLGAGGSIVNLFEQNIDPLTEKQLNLKRTARPAPIIFQSDVSGTTVLPYDFEAQKWSIPVLDKSYELRQREAIEKRGLPAYAFGIGVDYYGLKGAPSLVKVGAKIAPKLFVKLAKPALPRLGREAFSTLFHSPGLEQFGKSKGILSKPGEKWDVAEPIQKVGLRIEKKVQPTWAVQKQQLPVPNPFGKERIIPYYLRQGISRVTDFGKRVIEKPNITTPIWLKNFGDISLNPKHLGDKPNIPTRQQLERPPEYKRTYPTLGIMRNIFYPDIPAPRSKAPLIPSGFTKINPKTITAKQSAKKIIKLPSLFKSKLSLPKPKTPQFVKRSQQQWQGFVFMQKKRIGEFKETLPTFPSLPKPKANQFVTIQRKIRDIKSGIGETKRLGLQLFEWPTAKKQVVPAYSKREMINFTREDTTVPVIAKKKLRPLDELIPDMVGNTKITKIDLESLQKQIDILEANKSFTFREAIAYDIKTQKPALTIIDEDYLKTERGIKIRIEGVDLLTGEKISIGGTRFGKPDDLLAFLYKEQKRLTPSTSPIKSPPFMEGFMEMPFRARSGKAPIEISRFSDVSGLGSISPKPQSFYNMRRRFPSAPVEFGIIPKGTGMDSLKGPAKEWSENWMLKQRKVSSKDYLDRLEKIQGKRQWVEYPTSIKIKESPFRSALPSKGTRITSERYRQMPKMDPSWPKPPSPAQGDEFMNQLTALRRQMKGETNMLFSDPRRTSKVNVRLIKNEMEGLGYFKTATPFQLKQPKLADWPDNWKQLAETKTPDVADYLSQKRSFRKFGTTEKERMLKGVGGAGASSYPDVSFGRFGKQKGVPTNLFTLEKATPPVSFPVKRETGMFRMLERSAEEQRKLDDMWGQQMGRVLKERRKGELPDITTRSQDTSRTLTGKAKLSFVSEPLRTSPIVFQRGKGLFDTKLTVRKGSLVRGLKPVRGVWDYLPDKFAETRKAPKGGKPLNLSPWKLPKIEPPKEPDVFFTRQRVGKNILRDDTAIPSINPAGIADKQKFTLTKIKLGKGKTDTFGRKFEKSPLDSPTKDLSKRTNWDKLASESKKTKEQKDKAWEESQRAPKGGQILEPPGPRNVLDLPEPEVPAPEAIADVGAKVPFKKDKYKIPLIIPPTPKETKKERPVQTAQVYQEILLSDNRPKLNTIQTPRLSFAVSQPQKVQESFKISNIQTPRIKVAEITTVKPKQKERQRPRQISTPKYETIALTRITPKLRAAQTPKLASPLAPKAPTKLRAPQRQPLREKPVQVTLLRQTPPRKPPRVIFALPPDKEPEKKKSRKESKQVSGIYLGNVPETQISGVFRRREITLGKEKIERTRRGDVRVLLGRKRETRRPKKQEDLLGFKKGKKTTKFF